MTPHVEALLDLFWPRGQGLSQWMLDVQCLGCILSEKHVES